MADKESAASRIRKKKARIKSGELKWNRMGLEPGTKKPRRAIKEAEKIEKDSGRATQPSRKHITKHAGDYGVREIDAEIKKLEKKAEPKSSRRLREERSKPSGASGPNRRQRARAGGGGGPGGGRWHKDPKTGRRTWKIM